MMGNQPSDDSDEEDNADYQQVSVDDSLFDRVEKELDKPYTCEKTVAGVSVELTVSAASLQARYASQALSDSPVQVLTGAEPLFRDVARATEYTVTANGETVIDGGEPFSVRFLERDLMEEVGATRHVKEELIDSGFNPDNLDQTVQEAENAVVQFYRNIDIKDAELMAKSIAFNAAGDVDVDGADDLPETAEIREWIQDSRDQLAAAEEALDDMEGIARDLLGDDEFENATFSTDDADEGEEETELTTDVEEIRKQMYDSEARAKMFAEREETLQNGKTLKVETGPLVHEVVLESGDGSTERLARTDSEAEAVQEFNKALNDRR